MSKSSTSSQQMAQIQVAIDEPGYAELLAKADLLDNVLPKRYPTLSRQELRVKADAICTPEVVAQYQQHLADTYTKTWVPASKSKGSRKRKTLSDDEVPPPKRVRTSPSALQLLEDYRLALDERVWDTWRVKAIATFGPKKENEKHPLDVLDAVLKDLETFHDAFLKTRK